MLSRRLSQPNKEPQNYNVGFDFGHKKTPALLKCQSPMKNIKIPLFVVFSKSFFALFGGYQKMRIVYVYLLLLEC